MQNNLSAKSIEKINKTRSLSLRDVSSQAYMLTDSAMEICDKGHENYGSKN